MTETDDHRTRVAEQHPGNSLWLYIKIAFAIVLLAFAVSYRRPESNCTVKLKRINEIVSCVPIESRFRFGNKCTVQYDDLSTGLASNPVIGKTVKVCE